MKCTNDTNLQQTYFGYEEGDVELAGLSIPPIALTDGTAPGPELLPKRCLHEVKALFDSQVYLKAPQAPENTATRQQSMILDSIIHVVNGQSVTSRQSTSTTAGNTSIDSGSSTSTTNNNADTPTPVAADGSSKKKKKSATHGGYG